MNRTACVWLLFASVAIGGEPKKPTILKPEDFKSSVKLVARPITFQFESKDSRQFGRFTIAQISWFEFDSWIDSHHVFVVGKTRTKHVPPQFADPAEAEREAQREVKRILDAQRRGVQAGNTNGVVDWYPKFVLRIREPVKKDAMKHGDRMEIGGSYQVVGTRLVAKPFYAGQKMPKYLVVEKVGK